MQMDMAPHTHDGDPPVRTFAKGAAQYVHKLWHAAVHGGGLLPSPSIFLARCWLVGQFRNSSPDAAGWSANSAPSCSGLT